MNIINFYNIEETKIVLIEFTLEQDKDEFYREIKLDYDTIKYYSPSIIEDISDIDDDLLIDIMIEFFKENDYPEQLTF